MKMSEIKEMINDKFRENPTDAYMEMFETFQVNVHKSFDNDEVFYEDPIEGVGAPFLAETKDYGLNYDPRTDWHPEYKAIFEAVGECADMDDDEAEAWSYEINRPLIASAPSSNVYMIKRNFQSFKQLIEMADVEGNSNAFASIDFERTHEQNNKVREPKRADQKLNSLFYKENIDFYIVNAVKKALLYKYWSNIFPNFSESYAVKSKEVMDRVNVYITAHKGDAKIKNTIFYVNACLKNTI